MNGSTGLIVGCGYLGSRVAALWQAQGRKVVVLTRSAERANRFRERGWHPHVGDLTRPGTLRDLPAADSVLYAAAYDPAAGVSRADLHITGLGSLLDTLDARLRRLLFISTTGVHGTSDGSWIDERTPCEPASESGQVYLAAERLIGGHAWGSRAVILRMAGLYGPGRIPHLDSIRAGKPVPVAGDGFLNLIHVDDAADIVVAAEERAIPPVTYLVSDGVPVIRGEYYAELARLASATFAGCQGPPEGSRSAARSASSKRVRNQRMLADLGVALRYPDYKHGLAACEVGTI